MGTGAANSYGSNYVIMSAFVGQPDGKILVGGSLSSLNGQAVTPVVRLNADGTRDLSFTMPLSQGSFVGAVLLQPDSKVLVSC